MPATERSFLWKYLQIPARVLTTNLFDLKVHGIENVPRTGGVLLAANHQSYLDPVLVAVRLRRPVSFMAKSELFENPALRWLIESLHAYPVRQGEGDIGAIRQAIARLNAGYALNVYPEGTRTEDGSIAPLEKGIALILRKVDVPVVPVAIHGSFAAWPKSNKVFHPHPIRVGYGKPLYLKDLPAKEILEKLRSGIVSQFEELKKMDALDG
jgi:1-acyl-sn-glycerol-3-phosphate acyltransferase